MPHSRGMAFAFPPTTRSSQRLRPPRALTAHTRSQALVEFAVVLPFIFGTAVTLFQIGIIFMIYLAMVHSTRDIARWLVVHPDSTDTVVQAHVNANMPTILIPSSFDYSGLNSATASNWPWNPKCASLDGEARCSTRAAAGTQEVALTYNANGQIFLPTSWNFAGWKFTIPSSVPRYRYTVMIEPR